MKGQAKNPHTYYIYNREQQLVYVTPALNTCKGHTYISLYIIKRCLNSPTPMINRNGDAFYIWTKKIKKDEIKKPIHTKPPPEKYIKLSNEQLVHYAERMSRLGFNEFFKL
jgi:hypothetical protein